MFGRVQAKGCVVADGVRLPDGSWLPEETARAVVAAAELVWIQRSGRYIPRALQVVPDDRDLAELPPTVRVIQAILADRGDDDSVIAEGVTLPDGGWLPEETARAVVAAAEL